MAKTKSKRISLHKKYKIKRKINEHHRKARRAARKNPSLFQKKLTKDPGIPNSYPFKEQMMSELQEKRQEKIDARLQNQKKARQLEQDKRRNIVPEEASLEDYVINSRQKHEDFLKREEEIILSELRKGVQKDEAVKDGSMQAYFNVFKKVVESADVILEVLDARDPIGCRCPDVEKMITSKYPNKKIILVLNKIDLVPKDVVEKWIKYLRNELPTIAFKSSTQRKGKLSQATTRVKDTDEKTIRNASETLGAETLLQLLKHYSKAGKVKTTITVGLIGYPNVGKSSVINSMCRIRAAKVGGTPGVTKSMQEIHLDKHVKLLDSPGVVFPKATETEDDMVLRNVIDLGKVKDPVGPVEKILQRCKQDQLITIYRIPEYKNSTEFLVHIAKKRGMLAKGGIPVVKSAARAVLTDWTQGIIPFYTEPPALAKGVHVGASIVTEFAPDFDWDQTDTLRDLGEFNKAAEINGVSIGKSKAIHASDEYMTIMDDDEEEEEEEEEVQQMEEEEEVEPVEVDDDVQDIVLAPSKASAPAKKPPAKQDLSDDADQFNPQTNKSKAKLQKQQKKREKKQKKVYEVVQEDDDGTDGYSFATHFGLKANNNNDDEDISLDDIDA